MTDPPACFRSRRQRSEALHRGQGELRNLCVSNSQSVKDIIDAAKKKKVSPMELCEDAVDGGPVPDGLRTVMKKVGKFVSIIRKIRRAALQVSSMTLGLKLTRRTCQSTGLSASSSTRPTTWTTYSGRSQIMRRGSRTWRNL